MKCLSDEVGLLQRNPRKRSPINTLDGDLGADEMCMNDASHPSGSHCLRQWNDTNSWQKEQLCVLIDHTTSSTQLVLSYQDVLSLLMCIKSLPPTKQLERGVLCKVTSTDLIFIELVVTRWFALPATNFPGHSRHSEGICRHISCINARAQRSTHLANVDVVRCIVPVSWWNFMVDRKKL